MYDAALLEKNLAARDAETLHHPARCGPCEDCLEFAADDERPTLDQFVRHAELFGVECVYETAAEHRYSRRALAYLRVKLSTVKPIKDPKGNLILATVPRQPTKEERILAREYLLEDLGKSIKEASHELGISETSLRMLGAPDSPERVA